MFVRKLQGGLYRRGFLLFFTLSFLICSHGRAEDPASAALNQLEKKIIKARKEAKALSDGEFVLDLFRGKLKKGNNLEPDGWGLVYYPTESEMASHKPRVGPIAPFVPSPATPALAPYWEVASQYLNARCEPLFTPIPNFSPTQPPIATQCPGSTKEFQLDQEGLGSIERNPTSAQQEQAAFLMTLPLEGLTEEQLKLFFSDPNYQPPNTSLSAARVVMEEFVKNKDNVKVLEALKVKVGNVGAKISVSLPKEPVCTLETSPNQVFVGSSLRLGVSAKGLVSEATIYEEILPVIPPAPPEPPKPPEPPVYLTSEKLADGWVKSHFQLDISVNEGPWTAVAGNRNAGGGWRTEIKDTLGFKPKPFCNQVRIRARGIASGGCCNAAGHIYSPPGFSRCAKGDVDEVVYEGNGKYRLKIWDNWCGADPGLHTRITVPLSEYFYQIIGGNYGKGSCTGSTSSVAQNPTNTTNPTNSANPSATAPPAPTLKELAAVKLDLNRDGDGDGVPDNRDLRRVYNPREVASHMLTKSTAGQYRFLAKVKNMVTGQEISCGEPKVVDIIAEDKCKATGGVVTEVFQGSSLYRVHTFNSVGTHQFSVSKNCPMDVLVVAGGGGGGGGTKHAAGGGAGGVLYNQNLPTQVASYSITVGAGGAAKTNGSNSSLIGSGINLIAVGGGRGGCGLGDGSCPQISGAAGGSGGGGAYKVAPQGGAGVAGQGNQGGNAKPGNTSAGGGGGGAGGAGGQGRGLSNGNMITAGGDGGVGKLINITGANLYYGGGGGGTGESYLAAGGQPGAGGAGGGGAGGASGKTGAAGAPNTGGGGGAGGAGGAGGSGIVIIRYQVR